MSILKAAYRYYKHAIFTPVTVFSTCYYDLQVWYSKRTLNILFVMLTYQSFDFTQMMCSIINF